MSIIYGKLYCSESGPVGLCQHVIRLTGGINEKKPPSGFDGDGGFVRAYGCIDVFEVIRGVGVPMAINTIHLESVILFVDQTKMSFSCTKIDSAVRLYRATPILTLVLRDISYATRYILKTLDDIAGGIVCEQSGETVS